MVKRTGAKIGTVEDGAPAVPNNPAAAKACACGCGEMVVRMFKQGHDQRLVSNLAVDLVDGTGTGLGIIPKKRASDDIQSRIDEVTDYVSKKLSPALAAKVNRAAMVRWDRALRNKKAAEAKASKPARATKNPKPAAPVEQPQGPRHPVDPMAGLDGEPTEDAPLATDGYGLGAAVKVKVGRYVYDGTVAGMNQAGKVTAVNYVNKAGNERTIQTPREIKLV